MSSASVAWLAFTVAAVAGQTDWPDFRGPTGQGHSTSSSLPTKWSATENVAWKQPIPGLGWSSPAIMGGRIFVTSAVPVSESEKELSLRAICLDAASGRELWNVELFVQDAGAPKIHGKNSHASPSPVVSDGRVYVHFGHQGTACLDVDGKLLWRNRDLQYSPVHGNGGTPALVGDVMVFSCDGAANPFVCALDRATGTLRWKTERTTDAPKKFSFSTPLAIEVDGKTQVISSGSNCVCAYDPKTGQEIWRVRYQGYSVIPRPVYGHGLLFLGTGYDSPTVMAIRPGGTGDVTDTHVAWTVKKGAPHTPSLLLIGDELYMVSDRGVASCLDAKTGQEIWTERLGGNYSASPLFGDGKIYFQSEEGDTTVIRPGKTFQEVSKNSLGERTLASMAVSGSSLFIRTEKHLFRVE